MGPVARLEVRSFGWLLQDLLESHAEPQNEGEAATLELIKETRSFLTLFGFVVISHSHPAS